jgi:hemolysin III
MLICSALYNASGAPRRKDMLRRFDHAAIFVMIAGTYTPFLAMKIDGIWGHWQGRRMKNHLKIKRCM